MTSWRGHRKLYFSVFKTRVTKPRTKYRHGPSHAIKIYGGGVEIQLHLFIISAVNGSGQLHGTADLHPKKPRCQLNKRQGAPHSQSGRFKKRNISWPAGIGTPDRPARSLVTTPTELTGLLPNNVQDTKLTNSTQHSRPPPHISKRNIRSD